jgi:hypothetical protein
VEEEIGAVDQELRQERGVKALFPVRNAGAHRDPPMSKIFDMSKDSDKSRHVSNILYIFWE